MLAPVFEIRVGVRICQLVHTYLSVYPRVTRWAKCSRRRQCICFAVTVAYNIACSSRFRSDGAHVLGGHGRPLFATANRFQGTNTIHKDITIEDIYWTVIVRTSGAWHRHFSQYNMLALSASMKVFKDTSKFFEYFEICDKQLTFLKNLKYKFYILSYLKYF